MNALQVYGLTKCSTCQKARAWLEAQDMPYVFTDYREHPIAAQDLQQYEQQLGGWPKLVNRASMTWRNLPDDVKQPASDADWLALIAQYPALVRRPLILRADGAVQVGFSEKKFADFVASGV